MRLFNPFLLAGAAVFALPSPQSDLIPRSPIAPVNGLTLTQPLNTTPSLTDDWPTICYHILLAPQVDRRSCNPLIDYFASTYDYRIPKTWVPGPSEPEWKLQGCKLRVVSGKWVSRFSMQDVVVQMERVLETCQPPTYMGVGGSGPVDADEGFTYAAFQVQVMGVRR